MFKWLRRLFTVLAIVYLTFQPFLPVALAVSPWQGNPWSGNSWEGNPWTGNPWDGSDLTWQGQPWQGNPWNGNPWNGQNWSGEGTSESPWDGNSWDGSSWYGNYWSMPGFYGNYWNLPGFSGNQFAGTPWGMPGFSYHNFSGNPWLAPGFLGNQFAGAPWLAPGFQGNQFAGAPWMHPGFNGNAFPGMPWMYYAGLYGPFGYGPFAYGNFSGNGTNADVTIPDLPLGYDVGKYIFEDVIMGQVDYIGNVLAYEQGLTSKMDYGGSFYRNLLLNGIRLGVKDQTLFELVDTYDTVKSGYDNFKTWRNLRSLSDTVSTGAGYAQAASNTATIASGGVLGAVSKFNLAGAAIGTGLSAFEMGWNAAKAYQVFNSDATGAEKTSAVADVTSSLGSTLMNGGAVAAAIPGGQVIGAGMAAVGAGIWVVSKGVKLFADNWQGGLWSTTKHIAKKAGEKIKKGWNKVKSFFGF